ncbi:hypothetical protein WR25_16385 [Diploscapter pachys]|uniref:Uncharacterized protein n=1 Tax=Diploscapter pachys TaxID=2018661 RepID=A0A2A2M3R4_9BILA|nr:hypothetical protein WR25_16385 [Diploscapter pachys]
MSITPLRCAAAMPSPSSSSVCSAWVKSASVSMYRATAEAIDCLTGQRAGDNHDRDGQGACVGPGEMRDELARRTAGRRAQHQRGDIGIGRNDLADDPRAVALTDGDRRLQAGFGDQRARGGGDESFGVLQRLFLDRRLHAAEGDELLRRDQSENFDAAAGLHGAARCKAQRDLRLRAIVDHDQG